MNKKWAIIIIVLALLLVGTAVLFAVLHRDQAVPLTVETTGPADYACDITRADDEVRVRFEAVEDAQWALGAFDEQTLSATGENGDFRVSVLSEMGGSVHFLLRRSGACIHEAELFFRMTEDGLPDPYLCAHTAHGDVQRGGEGTPMAYVLSGGEDGHVTVRFPRMGTWLWKSEGDCRIAPLGGSVNESLFDVCPDIAGNGQWPTGRTGQGTVWVGEPAATREELLVLRIDLTVNGDGSLTVTGHELTNDVPETTDLDEPHPVVEADEE